MDLANSARGEEGDFTFCPGWIIAVGTLRCLLRHRHLIRDSEYLALPEARKESKSRHFELAFPTIHFAG